MELKRHRRVHPYGPVAAACIWMASTCAGPPALADESTEQQPNLLFIYTDDQRFDGIGYMNPVAFTPHLDRLSAEGLRFNQAVIVLPVCTPSRASVLTGRYSLAHGAQTYGDPIRREEVTFACLLQRTGYFTAMVGKWHNPLEEMNHTHGLPGFNGDPRAYGFDEVRDLGNTRDFFQPVVFENGVQRRAPGTSLDYEIDATIEIIQQATESEQPFAVYLSLLEPHGKMVAGGFNVHMRDAVREHYRQHPWRTVPVPPSIFDDLSGKPPYLTTYRGRMIMVGEEPMTPERYQGNFSFLRLVTEMDFTLGRLFAALERKGLRENTYIVFMSDNGLFRGEHGFGSKGLHYEESVRVPLFIVGPGIAPGFDNRSLPSNLDIAPTLLDLAGLEIPANMHGQSLKPVLQERTPLDRDFVLLELPQAIPALGVLPAFGLRSQRWKYIQTFEDGLAAGPTFEELYDLLLDRWEMNNLADAPEQAERMRALREELERRLGDIDRQEAPE